MKRFDMKQREYPTIVWSAFLLQQYLEEAWLKAETNQDSLKTILILFDTCRTFAC